MVDQGVTSQEATSDVTKVRLNIRTEGEATKPLPSLLFSVLCILFCGEGAPDMSPSQSPAEWLSAMETVSAIRLGWMKYVSTFKRVSYEAHSYTYDHIYCMQIWSNMRMYTDLHISVCHIKMCIHTTWLRCCFINCSMHVCNQNVRATYEHLWTARAWWPLKKNTRIKIWERSSSRDATLGMGASWTSFTKRTGPKVFAHSAETLNMVLSWASTVEYAIGEPLCKAVTTSQQSMPPITSPVLGVTHPMWQSIGIRHLHRSTTECINIDQGGWHKRIIKHNNRWWTLSVDATYHRSWKLHQLIIGFIISRHQSWKSPLWSGSKSQPILRI